MSTKTRRERSISMAERRGLKRVYFVQSGTRGPIKIGSTRDVEARIRELQTGCPTPLRLLLDIAATQDFESVMHRRFASARIHGEWFNPTRDLLRFISLELFKRPSKELLPSDDEVDLARRKLAGDDPFRGAISLDEAMFLVVEVGLGGSDALRAGLKLSSWARDMLAATEPAAPPQNGCP